MPGARQLAVPLRAALIRYPALPLAVGIRAERFAIDYLQLSPDGRIFSGAADQVESYPFFGADIRAVADGPVVAVLDGQPEQTPGVTPTGLSLAQYGGNPFHDTDARGLVMVPGMYRDVYRSASLL